MSCLIDADKIYIGDHGTAIILDTEEDLTGADALTIEAAKPGLLAVGVSWDGTQVETTKIRIVTEEGDIDVAGEWRLQAKVVMPSGTWYGKTVRMMVHKRFQ